MMSEIAYFEQEVLQTSHSIPVVVDFWAPWCGPCQFLGPVIEELANEANEQWKLVKINTDENQEVSLKYGIRGIPAVKMFYKGEVVAEFTGALPKHQIQKWLDAHLPNESKEQLKNIQEQLFTDQHQHAVQQLESFLEYHKDVEEGWLWLAAATVGQNPERSKKAAQATQSLVMGEDILSLVDLMECQQNGHPKVVEKIQTAKHALQSYHYEQAIQALIEAIMFDKHFCRELPRRASVALFRLMGDNHPLTKKYRRQFDMSLY